jgi:hypothetical protein
MTYDVFLSVPTVVAILGGVAMLATLTTLVLGAFGESEVGLATALFGWLATIWATVVLVIVLIRLVF